MKQDTYNPKARRQHYTHSTIRQWNDACREIDRRRKAMQRAAGVYKPGSEHYPYPEPNTETIARKINDYFQRISKQEHERLTQHAELYAHVYGI